MVNSLTLTKAQNAVTAHDWSTAARLYKELLRTDTSNIDYLRNLGSIYTKAGEDEKAIPYYEQIITFKPDAADAMICLGAIYRRLHRYEESISILQKALDEGHSRATVNYNLGFTYKDMGNYDDAIDAFESVIAEKTDDVLAYNHLGSIYFAQKQNDKSIATFKRGLQVDPNHPILNYNLAHCYESEKNFPEAVRCYENALKTRPGWTDAIRDFSELLIKCQQTKQAQDLVEHSIKLHPEDVDLLCILGRIYLNQFDYDNATKTFKKADSLKGSDIRILLGLAQALEKGEKIEQAMEKIVEAMDIDPENKEVRKEYIRVLLSSQRYDKALEIIKDLNEKTDEKDLQVLDLYGQYFICRGDDEAANAYFERIKKINHHYKDYMLNAADRYVQTGNLEKAEKFANEFVERRPQLPDGYNRLGKINKTRGDLQTAKIQYEKGVSFRNPNVLANKELEKINEELKKNRELFDDENPPIEVDAAEKPQEEIAENQTEDSLIENQNDEDFDYSQMGDNAPMGEALVEKEDDFWEDFDDDPDAQKKPLVDEENAYDENDDEASDAFEMMPPTKAAPDSDMEGKTSNPLSEDDGDFDFDQFDDGDVEDANSAMKDSEPSANSYEDSEEMDPFENEPILKSKPESQEEPSYEPEMDYEPEQTPAASEMQNQSPFDTRTAMNTAGNALDAAVMAQKMAQQLAEQQRQLEEQQKQFVEQLKEQNEKMIQESVQNAVEEAVEDAVEEAVEEKMQKSVDEQMEKIMNAEEMEIPEEEISVEEEEPLIEEMPVEEEEVAVEEEVPEVEEIAEEPEFEIEEELAEEVVEEPAEEVVEEPEIEMEEESAEEPAIEESAEEPEIEEELEEPSLEENPEDEFTLDESDLDDVLLEDSEDEIAEEIVDEPVLDSSETDEEFATVENVFGEDDTEEVTVEETTEEVLEEETIAEESPVEEDVQSDDTHDMLEKIERIISDDKIAEEYADEIELFKSLRVLANFLPENEKYSFMSCRMRMMIEYLIAKMSGKPGLLATAEAMLKSGVLGEEYNSQLEKNCEEDLSNELIRRVIVSMKKMADSLEDQELSKALSVSADGILEQIELANQKSQIF